MNAPIGLGANVKRGKQENVFDVTLPSGGTTSGSQSVVADTLENPIKSIATPKNLISTTPVPAIVTNPIRTQEEALSLGGVKPIVKSIPVKEPIKTQEEALSSGGIKPIVKSIAN
jgi:hypothetical protein